MARADFEYRSVLVLWQFAARELRVEVAFLGVGLAGKTTTLAALAALRGGRPLVSAAARGTRTTTAELDGPLHRALRLRVFLRTTPATNVTATSRAELLAGADLAVLVLDSSRQRLEEQRAELELLRPLLAARGLPVILQLNKRDAADAAPLEALEALAWPGAPRVETVATAGLGVPALLRELERGWAPALDG